jgi:hypothetical protein
MQELRHALSLHHKIYPHLPNPVAIVLMVAPILLKLGKSSPVALWLPVVTRVHGTAAAGSQGPPGGARPGHPLLAASLGGPRIGCGLHHCPLRFPFHWA